MTLDEYIRELKTKKIAVAGVGISNLPLVRLLLERGCDVAACDKRTEDKFPAARELRELGARLCLGDDYLDGVKGADVIFRTPGLMPTAPQLQAAVAAGAELTSEMEAFFKVCPCRIAAVTGSDGKTTTTTLIAELLKKEGYRVFVGGNIGTPLLTRADEMDADSWAVLELSSFQLMTLHAAPDICVVTNVAPNHLDIHRDMDEYVAAKRNIFAAMTEGTAVFNADNDITAGFAKQAVCRTVLFSRRTQPAGGVYLRDGVIYSEENGRASAVLSAKDILIPGVHNIENYMAAYAAVREYVSPETLRETAASFGGVEHRIELCRTLNGVRYYNDSIASSPTRTIAGLRSFDQKVILIAGGKDKGVPFDELGSEIVKHVKKLILTGFTADKLRAAVENAPEYMGEPEIVTVDDFRDAVLAARDAAQNGDVVILSPACTSFDRFSNFEERGNVFKKIVSELEER